MELPNMNQKAHWKHNVLIKSVKKKKVLHLFDDQINKIFLYEK